jgi:GrpB-like predicted nucleotidyltransferase (UPF0157 family)
MVKIIAYQTRWPHEFQEIADDLRRGLGNLALRIDHIGSTSVPGLAAKDIIDIQITVAALDDDLNTAMEFLGYKQPVGIRRDHCPPTLDPSESEWEKWLFKPPTGKRKSHIHVRVENHANQRYPLLFRDYLRTHPATAGAYAALKKRLAENLAEPNTYPEVKDPAVDLIYFAAEEWALATDWQPGPSDA